MKNRTRKGILNGGLYILFILLINWLSDFNLIQPIDIKTLIIIFWGTSILIVLSLNQYTLHTINASLKFNIFSVGIILTFVEMYNTYSIDIIHHTLLRDITIMIKPLLYCYIIYVPSHNLLKKYSHMVNHENNLKGKPFDISLLLSRREVEIFNLAVTTISNKEIASELYISESTVKKHIQNINKKLNCKNRNDLIQYYEKNA